MRKKLLLVSFMLLIGIALIRIKPAYATTPTFTIVPNSLIISAPGQNATIDITVADSPACVQWVLNLTWNPAYIDIAHDADIVEGAWLKGSPPRATMFLVKPTNHTAGTAPEITDLLMVAGTQSGSGVLLSITFTGVAQGISEVNMGMGLVIDELGAETEATLSNGTVNVVPEFAFMLLPVFLTVTAIAIAATTIWSRKRRGSIGAP